MIADIETLGWTADKKFFEVKLNIPTGGFLEESVRDLARIFIYHYSGNFSGCDFITKFALLSDNKAFIHPYALYSSGSVDEDFIAIPMTEYLELKGDALAS